MSSLNSGVYGASERTAPSEVPLARLDDTVRIDGPRVSLIKVDIQGHELEVLRGAGVLISHHRPVLILEHEDSLFFLASEANRCKADLKELLQRLRYETLHVSRWGSGFLVVVDWSRHLNGDLLALPLDDPDAGRHRAS